MLKKKKKRKIHVSSHNSRGISRATTEKGGGGRTEMKGAAEGWRGFAVD